MEEDQNWINVYEDQSFIESTVISEQTRDIQAFHIKSLFKNNIKDLDVHDLTASSITTQLDITLINVTVADNNY